MLDLSPDDEQQAVTELAHRIGVDLLAPAAKEAEAARAVPDRVWRTLFDTGLVMAVPERFGGGGVPDAVTQVLAVEGLAYGDAGIAMAAVAHAAAPLLVALGGTEEQAAAWLPGLGSDPARRSAVAVHEGYGRAPSESATTVAAGPDGSWRVRGRKVAVAAGPAAELVVIVGVDPADGRLRAVLVPTGAADGRGGPGGPAAGLVWSEPEGHLALDAAPTATVTFDLTVPAAALLGGPDADPTVVERAVGRLRLAAAAAAVGTAQRAVDHASAYAGERVAFGRPIASFQGVSFLLAEGLIRVAAARLEVADAAARLDAAGGGTEAAVTRAVNYAGVVATQTTRDALQVLGGHGFITDHPVERWYRTAAALAAVDFDPLCSSFEPVL